MGRLVAAVAATAVIVAMGTQGAAAQTTTTTPEFTPVAPAPVTPTSPAPAPVAPAKPVKPKPVPKPSPKPKPGQKPPADTDTEGDEKENTGGTESDAVEGTTDPDDIAAAALPLPAPASCGDTSVPAFLIPIYQEASRKYGLGPSGPSILAAINEIETGFGVNQGPSYAGAVGWMQFMPPTWDAYGVDANGDGVADPSDPQDAIHAAANYLKASGMPEDPEGAIFAYNHADWYVADVLERAACFGGIGNGALGDLSLIPKRQQLICSVNEDAGKVPEGYLEAFQKAAGDYEIGEEGVWALAAIARLESDYGRGMTPAQLLQVGPLGISQANWERYRVDGDADGVIKRESIGDASATVARMIWGAGSIRAGVFQHNHAAWYVQEVLEEAEPIAGKCRVRTVAYSISLPGPTSIPIRWENVELSNELELWDIQQNMIDGRVLALIAAISQEHTITISSLRSDHSMNTAAGGVSNHYFGRAVDIAAIDGVSCTNVTVDGPCGTIARSLAALPDGLKPTELIFCFDPDGDAGPAFAAADHCDHIHAGFDS
jgi:membrane-bound lytic murein transglycosylase B